MPRSHVSTGIIFSLIWLFPGTFLAQPSNLSGVINDYAEVSYVDTLTNQIVLANPADTAKFALYDLVLIYQTQGASIINNVFLNWGPVSDINGAGSFELGRICAMNGNQVAIENKLLQTYFDTAISNPGIQMIRVPEYVDAEVSTTLTAQAWNGASGGVLALSVSDTLYVHGSMDVSLMGFRGGELELNPATCGNVYNSTRYAYGSSNGPVEVGAKKGEGISDFLINHEYGRGSQANGGGGGNIHNTGGGGGGNGAAGGNGGYRLSGFWGCYGDYPGIGGVDLSGFGYDASNQRAFLGGGGGAGEKNNAPGCEDGGNGGGLILIMANVIVGNGSILANGGSVGSPCSDGNGGGGAGGSILLNANSIVGSGLNIQANGGNGGSTSINCEGPGGGGSGGVIWSSVPMSGTLSFVYGGVAGQTLATACFGSNQGATAGGTGLILSSGLAPPLGLTPFPCVLQAQGPSQVLSGELTPNPDFRVFLVNHPSPSPVLHLEGLTQDRPLRWELYNLLGQPLASGSEMAESTSWQIEPDFVGLKAGTYLIRVIHSGEIRSLRLILLR